MNRGSGVFKKVTHVIFDLDGLLLDTERLYTEATQNVVEPYGKVYSPDLKRQVMGLTHAEVAAHIVHALALPITTDAFMALMFEQIKQLMPNADLMPGAEKIVRHLHKHNVPIAVATSSSKQSYDLKVTRHKELFSLFHHSVMAGSDPEVEKGKPHPDIFLICATRFTAKPKQSSDCLVLEDAPNGVKAALDAGMQCIMVPDPAIVGPEFYNEATLVLPSLEELKPETFGLPPYDK